jgi:AcrR family transcriptional regulator
MSEQAKPKGPGGRPSLYKPEYCERVLELGREGMSVVEMAAEIGVSRSTLEEHWPAAHEEFCEAFARARELSQAWWERQGRVGLTAERFNAQVYSRSMAARFPKDWRESKNVDSTVNVQLDEKKQAKISAITDMILLDDAD